MPLNKIIPVADVAGVSSMRSRIDSGPALEHRRAFWSIIDYGAISAGNFVTTWYLARKLAPIEFGTFAILLGVIFLANTVHAALISFPLSVKSTEDSNGADVYTGWSVLLTVGLSPLSVLSVLIAAAVLRRSDLALVTCLTVLCWQLHETTRAALIARFRYRDALIGDSLSYIGRATAIVIMIANGHRDLTAVFLAISIASSCAVLVQIGQLGFERWRTSGLGAYSATAWNLGRWWLYGRLANVITAQGFPWILALRGGPAAAAGFQALVTVMSAINPILFSMNNVVLCSVSESFSRHGAIAAIRSALRYTAAMSLPIAAYSVALYAFPGYALKVFYGAASPYRNFDRVLQILVFAYVADVLASASLATLGGMQRTRHVFATQCLAGAFSAAFALPCAFLWGLVAAAIGLAAVNTVRAAASTLFLLRVRNEGSSLRSLGDTVLAADLK